MTARSLFKTQASLNAVRADTMNTIRVVLVSHYYFEVVFARTLSLPVFCGFHKARALGGLSYNTDSKIYCEMTLFLQLLQKIDIYLGYSKSLD